MVTADASGSAITRPVLETFERRLLCFGDIKQLIQSGDGKYFINVGTN
jgi:hypothetical protein